VTTRQTTYVKAVPELQSFLSSTRWSEEALSSLAEHAADEEVHAGRCEQGDAEEVAEDEDEGYVQGWADAVGVGEAPG